MGRFSKARIRRVRTIVKTEVVVCFVVFSRHCSVCTTLVAWIVCVEDVRVVDGC